ALGGPVRRRAFDREGDDLARLGLRFLLGLLACFADHLRRLDAHFLLHVGEEHLLGVFDGEAGDAAELTVEVVREAPDPVALLPGLHLGLLYVPLPSLEGPLPRPEPRVPLVQPGVALVVGALLSLALAQP